MNAMKQFNAIPISPLWAELSLNFDYGGGVDLVQMCRSVVIINAPVHSLTISVSYEHDDIIGRKLIGLSVYKHVP